MKTLNNKQIFRIHIWTFFLIAISIGSVKPQQNIPTTPVGEKLKAAIEVINSGNIEAITSYVNDNYTPGFHKLFGKDRLFDFYYGLFEQFGGVDLSHFRDSSTNRLNAILRCRETETGYLFGLKVTKNPPHLIDGMSILPLAYPAESDDPVKLSDGEISDKLEFILQRLCETEVFSGIVLIARNDKIIFQKACGWAVRESKTPNITKTIFNLASINKPFTAVAIAQLNESGKLSYEDPIGNYLGQDWIPAKVGKNVKIKHLLSHTSGIGGGDFNIKYVEESVKQGYIEVEDYKSFSVNIKLKFKPGKKHEYSNLGYHLLGAIIENVSGKNYYDYINSNVFKPAGMTNAGFYRLADSIPNLAIGYVKLYENGEFYWKDNRSDNMIKGSPAGCGYATSEDLLKFSLAMSRNTLVSTETKKILFSAKKELNSPSYGFGFVEREIGGKRLISHTGGYIGINNSFTMVPEDNLTIILLTNIDIISRSAESALGAIIKELLGIRY